LFKTFIGPLSANAQLLEIGCGTGIWTEVLARLPCAVTSMDLSEDLLGIARRKSYAHPVHFICGDVEHLSFPDHTWDVVCGLSVLHHLDLKAALREIYRVLKPGGRFLFSEPNMLNPQILIQKNIPWIKRWAGDTPDETAFFRWPLVKNLRAVGFEAVRVEPFDFLHPQVPAFLTQTADRIGQVLEKIPVFREIAGSLWIQGRRPLNR
jgi:SAM-dependent methyltransferase